MNATAGAPRIRYVLVTLFAFVAGMLSLLTPQPARAAIEPAVGIAGAHIDMSRTGIKAVLGTPRKILRSSSPPRRVWLYRRLRVEFFHGDHATRISTTRRSQYTTDTGLHVGSTGRQVRAAYPDESCGSYGTNSTYCAVGPTGGSTEKSTWFIIKRRKVVRIFVEVVI